MKKTAFIILSITMFLVNSKAQKSNKQINIGAGIGIPIGNFGEDYKPGITSTLKGFYGVGRAGQVGFTTGLARFIADIEFNDQNGVVHRGKERKLIIPFLASYRHHFDRLYVEPQAGFEFYLDVLQLPGVRQKDHGANFPLFAAGMGYILPNNLELGFRYQFSDAYDFEGSSFLGIQLAYNFKLK